MNSKDVFQLTVKGSCPEFDPVRGIDQFGDDSYSIALFAHRSLEERGHAELFANSFGFLFSVLKTERRTATDDLELSDLSKSCD